MIKVDLTYLLFLVIVGLVAYIIYDDMKDDKQLITSNKNKPTTKTQVVYRTIPYSYYGYYQPRYSFNPYYSRRYSTRPHRRRH